MTGSYHDALMVTESRTQPRWAPIAAGVCLAWIWGCGPASSEATVGQHMLPVAQGVPAPLESSVVGVWTGRGLCTGTLILPNLVLTAHHCVADTPDGPVVCGKARFSPPREGGFSVTTALDARQGPTHAVSHVFVPPDAVYVCGGDVALLLLARTIDAAEAWPIPPRIDEDPERDEVYRALGYGETDSGEGTAGVRRERGGLIVECAGMECTFDYPTQINEWVGESGMCQGDSGGPALDAVGRVFGVTSRGAEGCLSPIYSNVADWADWIMAIGDQAVQNGGYEPAPWVYGGSTLPTPKPVPDEQSPVVSAHGGCATSSAKPAGRTGADAAAPPPTLGWLLLPTFATIR